MDREAAAAAAQGRARAHGLTARAHERTSSEDWVDQSLPSTPIDESWSWSAVKNEPDDGDNGQGVDAEVEADLKPDIDDRINSIDSEPIDSERLDDRGDTPLRELGVDTPPPPDPEAADDRQCRICFGGAEDEEEMGRLISPCLCTGSMRYVHVKCINAWRGTGTNAKAFLECPQCHHQYAIRRTLVLGLATSRPILILTTSILFLALTLLAGHIMLKFLLASASALASAPSADDAKGGDGNYEYYYEDEDGSTWYVYSGGGGMLVYDVMIEAVETFLTLSEKWYIKGRDSGVSVFWITLVLRLILGLSVLGSLSFLSLLLSLSLFAPLQIINQFRGVGLFGNFNFGRRRGDGSRGSAGTVVMVVVVVIGVINTVIQVYDTVRAVTQRMLRYVETQILEVNPEDRRRAREQPPGWWGRWWHERRWRTMRGWYEVLLRGWVAVKEWIRVMRETREPALEGAWQGVPVQ